MNAMICLLTECCKEDIPSLDVMLCCYCCVSALLVYHRTGHAAAPPPSPDLKSKKPAPLARSLAKIEELAPEPWPQDPALLRSLGTLPLWVVLGARGELLCSSMAACSTWLGGCGGDGRAGGLLTGV